MLKFICAALLLVSVGCGKRDEKKFSLNAWMESNGKVKVLSTTAMIDDLVAEIVDDKVDHLTLVTGELDPHSYELVKGDDEKLQFAQILFFNGLGLEHGASLHHRLKVHPGALAIGEEIQKSCPGSILKVDGQSDPHLWMDISLWMKAIDPIVKALSVQDPAHASFFEERAVLLRAKMIKADEEIAAQIKQIPKEKRFLVTSHDAFSYFAKRYLADSQESEELSWHQRFAAPEGISPEGQLSTAHIQKIIDHLTRYRIGIVFPESNVSKDSLKKIVNASQEKGLAVKISKEVLYGDAMGPPGSGADSYLKMMQHNAEVLQRAWQ